MTTLKDYQARRRERAETDFNLALGGFCVIRDEFEDAAVRLLSAAKGYPGPNAAEYLQLARAALAEANAILDRLGELSNA